VTKYAIPFNKACFEGNEQVYMAQAVANGHISGDGPYTKRAHTLLEEALAVRKALLTTSCTHALEMAALLLDIQPGDEVIVPSFTFVSTINAFVLRGAWPVLSISAPIHSILTSGNWSGSSRRAHGRSSCPLCRRRVRDGRDHSDCKPPRVAVIEDNAHGLFGTYKGKYLGTFGSMATQSFHETRTSPAARGRS
jgi:dTDP-4-amino-4,6-dideoxygalactose transaminase